MKPRIEILPEKKLAGKRLTVSFVNCRTAELWSSFMPRRKEIKNNIGSELFSVQYYRPLFFESINPTEEFDKWATVEVSDFNNVPEGMVTLTIQSGLYAVFIYKGDGSDAENIFTYILKNWLPASEYELDDRLHFEILGEKYKRNDPDSEEEIWIPVKKKINQK